MKLIVSFFKAIKRNIAIFIGAVCFVILLAMSTNHTLDNYGIADSNDVYVLGQLGTTDTTSNSGGTGNGGTGGFTDCRPGDPVATGGNGGQYLTTWECVGKIGKCLAGSAICTRKPILYENGATGYDYTPISPDFDHRKMRDCGS